MPEGLTTHEDATVTIPLDHYLSLKNEVEGKNKKLQVWKEGLEHVEIFLSFLRDSEEEMIEEQISNFNNTYDEAQITVKNGRVHIDIRPEASE